jgi:hypothetical protein
MQAKKWTIDQNDPVMCDWAFRYLQRSFRLPDVLNQANPCSTIYAVLNNLPTKDARELLLKKMGDAWRQKEYRDKQKKHDRKSCSYILSVSTLKQLNKLKNDCNLTINETLELVINQTYLAVRNQKKRPRKQSSHTQAEAAEPYTTQKDFSWFGT